MPIKKIHHDFEPVVSMRLKSRDPHQIDKLIGVVGNFLKADPIAIYRIDKENGEIILSGVDFLYIELLAKRISKHIDIDIEEPNVVYRERISKKSKQFLAKSANDHNGILLYVEPLDEKMEHLILSGKINYMQDEKEIKTILSEEVHWDVEKAKQIVSIYQGCLLINDTTDIQWFKRIKGSLINAFREWVDNCILAGEPATGIKAVFTELVIHEDPSYTQYDQIAGMVLSALSLAMLDAEPHLFEPVHKIDIEIPERLIEPITEIIKKRRGQIVSVISKGDPVKIEGIIPTAEIFGLADRIENVTREKIPIYNDFLKFEKLPENIEEKTILTIRKRKELPEKLPSIESWDIFPKKIVPKMNQMRDKISSIMKEENLTTLVIDRKYLAEVIDVSFCHFYSGYIPKLNFNFEYFLRHNGIKIEYQGNVIKFIKE